MKNNLDQNFNICLLLITVIAAAELQYACSVYPSEHELVNGIFRWTTVPMLFIITFWLVLILLPSLSIKLGGLEKYVNKRVGKEFCWAFFGNFYVLVVITFWALSFTSDIDAVVKTSQWATVLMFFLTLYVTWQYRKADFYEMQRPTRKIGKQVFITIGEHLILYFITYIVIYVILGYAIILPTPAA